MYGATKFGWESKHPPSVFIGKKSTTPFYGNMVRKPLREIAMTTPNCNSKSASDKTFLFQSDHQEFLVRNSQNIKIVLPNEPISF
jgi:hypothetical protein